jgi:hypothetical protein
MGWSLLTSRRWIGARRPFEFETKITSIAGVAFDRRSTNPGNSMLDSIILRMMDFEESGTQKSGTAYSNQIIQEADVKVTMLTSYHSSYVSRPEDGIIKNVT